MTFNFAAAALFLIVPTGITCIAGLARYFSHGWYNFECVFYIVVWLILAFCVGVLF